MVNGALEKPQYALLWWLVDELRRTVRDKADFETWLLAQHIDGVFAHEEKQQVAQGAKKVLEVAKEGAPTLIEALVKRLVGS